MRQQILGRRRHLIDATVCGGGTRGDVAAALRRRWSLVARTTTRLGQQHLAKATSILSLELYSLEAATTEVLPLYLGLPFSLYVTSLFYLSFNL